MDVGQAQTLPGSIWGDCIYPNIFMCERRKLSCTCVQRYSFVKRYKALAWQCFSLLTKLSMCLWSWAWSVHCQEYFFLLDLLLVCKVSLWVCKVPRSSHEHTEWVSQSDIPFFIFPRTPCLTHLFKISDLQVSNQGKRSCVNRAVSLCRCKCRALGYPHTCLGKPHANVWATGVSVLSLIW